MFAIQSLLETPCKYVSKMKIIQNKSKNILKIATYNWKRIFYICLPLTLGTKLSRGRKVQIDISVYRLCQDFSSRKFEAFFKF